MNCSDEARQSLEPVFNIAEHFTFQSFHTVFQTSFIDPALMSAVMHSLAFAVAGGGTNREYLGYKGRTFSYVRERMSSPSAATSESTIGAILLLAGVDVCKPCYIFPHVSSCVRLIFEV